MILPVDKLWHNEDDNLKKPEAAITIPIGLPLLCCMPGTKIGFLKDFKTPRIEKESRT